MDSIQKYFYKNLENLFNPKQGRLFKCPFCGGSGGGDPSFNISSGSGDWDKLGIENLT